MCLIPKLKRIFISFAIFKEDDMRLAVIDLGTNTFHLLIAEGVDKILYKTTVPVLLGQGRINQNMIIPEAMERGIRTLTQFKSTIDQYQVGAIKAVATSAVRSAENGHEFVKQAAAIGIQIEVITGEAEADYIFNGVMATGLIQQTTLVMDIGGGSTEFIICNPQGALWKKSYNIGAARLMQAYFHSDPLSEKEHQEIIHHLDNTLADLKTACAQYQPSLLVGSAGAFESFAALLNDGNEIGDVASANLDLDKYKAVSKRLISSTHHERARMKGLISLRVDMIVIAAIITDYVLERLNLRQLSLSTYDLKMGVLAKSKEYQQLYDSAAQLAESIDLTDASVIEKEAAQVITYIDTLLELGGDPLLLNDRKFTLWNYIASFANDEQIIAKYKSLALAQAKKCIDEYLTDDKIASEADLFTLQANLIGRSALEDEEDKAKLSTANSYMTRVAHLADWNKHKYFKDTHARLLIKVGYAEEAYLIIAEAPEDDVSFNELRRHREIRYIVMKKNLVYDEEKQRFVQFNYPAHPLVRQHAEMIIAIRHSMIVRDPNEVLKTYTPEDIELFEQRSGISLPDEFKVYLMELGSGGKGAYFVSNIPGLEEITSDDREKISIGISINEGEVFLLKNGEVWADISAWRDLIVSGDLFVPATDPTLNFLEFIAGSLRNKTWLTFDNWL
jgi:exopolyphosphatase/guanosine-5'-triphosphate,3'-diphosphate pyrophosphatase